MAGDLRDVRPWRTLSAEPPAGGLRAPSGLTLGHGLGPNATPRGVPSPASPRSVDGPRRAALGGGAFLPAAVRAGTVEDPPLDGVLHRVLRRITRLLREDVDRGGRVGAHLPRDGANAPVGLRR